MQLQAVRWYMYKTYRSKRSGNSSRPSQIEHLRRKEEATPEGDEYDVITVGNFYWLGGGTSVADWRRGKRKSWLRGSCCL